MRRTSCGDRGTATADLWYTRIFRTVTTMAKIHIKKQHNLGREEARARVAEIAKDLEGRLDARCSWKGDCLHFSRSGASGFIELGDGFIDLQLKLGLMLAPMRGKIEQAIRGQIEASLGSPSDRKKA